MQNADMKPNRLFSVALSANSGNRLSAATFEFTYDPDYIEFRKVKAVNNGSKIQVNKKRCELYGCWKLHCIVYQNI